MKYKNKTDGMLSEVGNNGNAFRYAASWVLEFLLGGPPRLRWDAGVWSVSLNDNKPSSPAAGQEEEEVFLPKCVPTHTPDMRVARSSTSEQPEVKTRHQEELSDIWGHESHRLLKAVINTRQCL